MTKYSPNYMKTLLNMYRHKELSANVMSCAKEFVKLLNETKSIEFFNVAKDKAQNDPDESTRPIYWDIVVLIAPWVNIEIISNVFNEALEMTKDGGANIQKKGFYNCRKCSLGEKSQNFWVKNRKS